MQGVAMKPISEIVRFSTSPAARLTPSRRSKPPPGARDGDHDRSESHRAEAQDRDAHQQLGLLSGRERQAHEPGPDEQPDEQERSEHCDRDQIHRSLIGPALSGRGSSKKFHEFSRKRRLSRRATEARLVVIYPRLARPGGPRDDLRRDRSARRRQRRAPRSEDRPG